MKASPIPVLKSQFKKNKAKNISDDEVDGNPYDAPFGKITEGAYEECDAQ